MMIPGRVSVPTVRLLALLELAGWAARSEAERLLVMEVRGELEQAAAQHTRLQQMSEAKEGAGDEADHSGAVSGSTGAESTGKGDSDGGSAGAESASALACMG